MWTIIEIIVKWNIFNLGELYFAVARCFQGVSFLEENEQYVVRIIQWYARYNKSQWKDKSEFFF
jgi:hypothetical protein